MTNTMTIPNCETNNIIRISVIDGKLQKQKDFRLNKDGSIDKRHSNKVAGVSSEVYPFTTEAEIKSMIDVFDKRIEEAPDKDKKWIAHRNKMLFLIGINLGIRASDLCNLKYSFFMNDDGTFKEHYSLKPKKTRKTNKFVKLYFNQTVKKAITNYIDEYNVDNLDEYLFKSRKGGAITEKSLWKIIVDAANDAGLEGNYGSHTLRKTFGFWVYHNAEDKNNALVILQTIFNHSSPAITSRYIGLTDNEISDVFNTLNLGDEFI